MDDPHFHDPLSPAGQLRRETMLVDLRRAVVGRRRARRARRAAAVALLFGLCSWPAMERWRGAPEPAPPVADAPVTRTPGLRADSGIARAFAALRVEVVRNDPLVLERCAATDDELYALLTEAHRNRGIVRVGDRVYLADELTGN